MIRNISRFLRVSKHLNNWKKVLKMMTDNKFDAPTLLNKLALLNFGKLITSYRNYSWKRKAKTELLNLDKSTLKDLAIDRSEVGSVIYGSRKSRLRSERSVYL